MPSEESQDAELANEWAGHGVVVQSVKSGRQQSGQSVCSFNLEVPTRSGFTTWVRINCFDRSLVGYIKRRVRKGSHVSVVGELMNRKTTGGASATLTEIRAFRITLKE